MGQGHGLLILTTRWVRRLIRFVRRWGIRRRNPRFIETLSRRGYRFIAPVGVIEPTA